ncbi:hypothetical protein POM88_000104 [Heracleum sosnowskyi]|uniref:Uncharacterized protein n=1 Tax=Heracleum sosnowskyi TaxID=360622 RepID=A0AAD8JBP0_9APIA|nr:hypothetical protein POM88_000104 [Heracleum sosnowskyi]
MGTVLATQEFIDYVGGIIKEEGDVDADVPQSVSSGRGSRGGSGERGRRGGGGQGFGPGRRHRCSEVTEVSTRQARVREAPIAENVTKLHASKARRQELKGNMTGEASAALAVVESQQQRPTFQRFVALIEDELTYHERVAGILREIETEIVYEKQREDSAPPIADNLFSGKTMYFLAKIELSLGSGPSIADGWWKEDERVSADGSIKQKRLAVSYSFIINLLPIGASSVGTSAQYIRHFSSKSHGRVAAKVGSRAIEIQVGGGRKFSNFSIVCMSYAIGIQHYSEGAKRDENENIFLDEHNCIDMDPECALKFVKNFGIRYATDYVFRGNIMDNPPRRDLDSPRIYISDYRILREFDDPDYPLTERRAYQALRFGCPMMGSVLATDEFINYIVGVIKERGKAGAGVEVGVREGGGRGGSGVREGGVEVAREGGVEVGVREGGVEVVKEGGMRVEGIIAWRIFRRISWREQRHAEAFTAVGYKHIEAGKKWTGSLCNRLFLHTL